MWSHFFHQCGPLIRYIIYAVMSLPPPVKIWEDNFFKGLRLEERFFPKKKKKIRRMIRCYKEGYKSKTKEYVPSFSKKRKRKKRICALKKKNYRIW